MANRQVDAVIIGAGVIGAACGFELAKKGWKTLNVDRLPAAGYGSTSNSCAIIRVYYSTVDSTALAYESYFYWKDWQGYLDATDERGAAKFHETGTLVMKTEHNGHLKRACEIMETVGIPYEHWSADQIRERLSIFDLHRFSPAKLRNDQGFGEPTGGNLEGGVLFPAGGYINDPQLSSHNLQRAAEAKGGAFVFGKKVVEILKSDNRITGVVLDDGETINTGVVINVAGPHSSKVNRMAGADGDMKITTRALKQEVVHVPSPDGFDFEETGLVVSDSDISCYSRPESGNHILIGSEDPECDTREFVDPDDWDNNFSEQWTTQAYRQAQRIPSLGIPSQMKGAVDLYDVTEDWAPIYDRSSVDGYYMAIGTSGNQFKNAPVAGKMMAALIDYCEAGNDHDANPLKFRLEKVGHELDLASFSRLREINKDSSFSVLG
jgi:sarcosine oxidase, subunit beta